MRKFNFGLLALGLVLASIFSACSVRPLPLSTGNSDSYQIEINRYQAQLDSILNFLETEAHRFGVDRPDQFKMLNPQNRRELVMLWGSMLDYMAHLDRIRYTNHEYYQKSDKEFDYTAFISYYQAFLIQSTRAMRFIQIIDRNEALGTIINEAHPEYGLDLDSYTSFKSHFLNVKQTAEYGALRTIYRHQRPEINPYYSSIAMLEGYASSLGWDYGVKFSLKHAFKLVGAQSYSLWFPIQKDIANWAGHTRFFRAGQPLISAADISDIQSQLKPGDIMFQRREWYMTNAGIPGYWTHAALYVGSPEERAQIFVDDSLIAWVQTQGVESGSFEELLRTRYPEAYAQNFSPIDSSAEKTVLEAISPGVVFQTLPQSLSCDGLGVVRPRFSQKDLAVAIYSAFHYYGRGYDYNFDFLTDSTLVCSELIYKSFFPSETFQGIPFKSEKIAGRLMTPANRMVRQFDQEFESLGLDFVLFYDGNEKERISEASDVSQFRASWRRLGLYPIIPSKNLLLNPQWLD